MSEGKKKKIARQNPNSVAICSKNTVLSDKSGLVVFFIPKIRGIWVNNPFYEVNLEYI